MQSFRFPKSPLRSHLPSIRQAAASDTREVSDLLRRAFQEFEPLYTPEAYVATVQPESGILRRMQEGPVWVAENDHGLVGTVSVMRSENLVFVRGMAVSPEARGQKIGKTLLYLAEDFARELGFMHMSLYTTGFLLGAIRLYQSSGFVFTGEKTSPHGTELLGMVKILESHRRA